MPDEDAEDILDVKQLGRSKEEEGRFTLTPAERKLARQTQAAGRKLDQDQAATMKEGPTDSLVSRKEGPSTEQSYAKGGQVGRVGSFGLKRSKPDFAGGGSMLNRRSFTKPNG